MFQKYLLCLGSCTTWVKSQDCAVENEALPEILRPKQGLRMTDCLDFL